MALGPFSKQDHLEITTLGLEFAVSEILGAGAGYFLDKHWGTSPWCLVAGAIAGFALGLGKIWIIKNNIVMTIRREWHISV